MPYTHTIVIKAESSGLNLQARLIDASGDAVGDPITSGFVDLGGGYYMWTYNNFPDSFRGVVAFYNTANSSLVAAVAINPEETNLLGMPLGGFYPLGSIGRAFWAVGSGIVRYATPMSLTGDITIHQGDDYSAADNRALEWVEPEDGPPFPDLSGATVKMHVGTSPPTTFSGVVVSNTHPKKIRVELTNQQTAALPAGTYPYELEVTLATNPPRVITLVTGTLVVTPQIA